MGKVCSAQHGLVPIRQSKAKVDLIPGDGHAVPDGTSEQPEQAVDVTLLLQRVSELDQAFLGGDTVAPSAASRGLAGLRCPAFFKEER